MIIDEKCKLNKERQAHLHVYANRIAIQRRAHAGRGRRRLRNPGRCVFLAFRFDPVTRVMRHHALATIRAPRHTCLDLIPARRDSADLGSR